MIILLDLNYTLVANSGELGRTPLEYRQGHERYRGWLIDLLKLMQPEKIILLTVRTVEWEKWTMARIQKLLHWQPDEAVFNYVGFNIRPEHFKERALKEVIFPKHGQPGDTNYLAVESNLDTHKMYAKYGIKGLKAFPSTEAVYEPDIESRRPALF